MTADPVRLVRRLDAELRRSHQAQAALTATVEELKQVLAGPDVLPLPTTRPAVYLTNWRDVLTALCLTNTRYWRHWVARANEMFDGPIILPRRGSQPLADANKLLAWWPTVPDRARARIEEQQQRQLDAAATVADTYLHGTDAAEVVPGICGSVKPRRQRKRSA